MKSFRKIFFQVLCLLVPVLSVRAGQVEHQDFIPAESLALGQWYSLSDPTYFEELADPTRYAAARENQVRLVYGRDQRSDVEGRAWSYQVVYQVAFTGVNAAPRTDTLLISTDGQARYADAQVYNPGGHRFAIKLLSVVAAGPVPANDIRLELRTTTERYTYLDRDSTVNLTWNDSAGTLHWDFIPGAESYDLEWSWIDARSGYDPALAFARAVRVNVPNQYYQPHLTYRGGVVYFRVRPVGRFINGVGGDYSYTKYGAWSAVVRDTIVELAGHEKQRNFTYSATYAEDGKFKKVLSYADGAGKTRQSLTHLSSDSTTVVTQTEYDREGRAVIATLPIPFRGIDLKYYDELNVKFDSAGRVFDPLAFDDIRHDPSNSQFRLSSLAGAAKYFSSDNDVGGLLRDYIPDAGGFPYTQVEFRRDATGRVARQGGVGSEHQLGSGHEARFFYGDATRSELYRIFGGNVGNANHYQKKMSLDPNGQVSLVWQDQAGQVVATALAGDAPNNLLELDNIFVDPVRENLDSNLFIDYVHAVSYHDHVILNERPGKTYDFEYVLEGVVDPVNCLCLDCEYTLEITVRGPDGALVAVGSVGAGNISLGDTIIYDTLRHDLLATCAGFTYDDTLRWSMTLNQIGDYKVSKVLTALPKDETALLDSLAGCPGFPSYQTIFDSLMGVIDTTICDPPCPDSFPIYARTDLNLVDIVAWDTAAGICNGTGFIRPGDIRDTECQGIYQQMLSDLGPGGWLHDSLAWVSVVGDSLATDSLLAADHREYCQYRACVEDAHSRWWDIQMAAAPTLSFAIDHGLIDTLPEADSIFDPWFDNAHWSLQPNWACPGGPGGNQNRPMTAFLDSLFATSTGSPGYQNSGYGILQYYDPQVNPDADLLGLFTANCGSSTAPGYAACADTLGWFLVRGAYLDVKGRMQIDYLDSARCCGYFDDGRAIVPPPIMPPPALTASEDWASVQTIAQCNATCAGNVAAWIGELTDSCAALTAGDSAALFGALMEFCLESCPCGNPRGLISDALIAAGKLGVVDSILGQYSGCAAYLDSIAVPDPYVYSQNGDSLKVFSTQFDPCFVGLSDLFNATWPWGGFPAVVALDSASALGYCYPLGADIRIDTGLEVRDGSGVVLCEAIRLLDSTGTLIPLNRVKRMSRPRYETTLPGGMASTVGSVSYQDIALWVSVDAGGAPWDNQSSQTAYLYSQCGFSVAQDSCLQPLMPVDSIWSPSVDPQADRDSCIANVIRDTEYRATQIYQAAIDNYANAALGEFHQQCFQYPYAEHFAYTHSPKVYQYMLYFHDQSGQLVQTVPPEGVQPLLESTVDKWLNGTADPTTDMPAHRMATRYRYNSLGQLRHSNTPDGGDSEFWYNGKDQLRLRQDARQALGDEFAYTKYDALGRTVETGQIEGYSGTVSDSLLNDFAFPTRSAEVLTDVVTTVYDTVIDPARGWAGNLRTRVAAIIREDAEGDTVAVCHYGYDEHGNVHRTETDLVGLGSFDLEYRYDLISGNINRVLYQRGRVDYFSHRYRYDGDNRLVRVATTRDDVFWDEDARYFYYAHGPLARLEIGQDQVQGQDYLYSIHGWIKGVNLPGATDGSVDPGRDGNAALNQWSGRDAYAYHLGFYEGDYDAIGGVSLGEATSIWNDMGGDVLDDGVNEGLYNGNIAVMVTGLYHPDSPGGLVNGSLANAYQYDQLNRIKQMQTWYRAGAAWTRPGGSSGIYKAEYDYDKNGNLDYLARRVIDRSINPWSSKSLDDLEYNYPQDGSGFTANNKLTHVEDNVPVNAASDDLDNQGAGNYTYDAIGNLIANDQEEIATITWDLYNKVRTVQRSPVGTSNGRADLQFWYDGMGNRVRKRVIAPLDGGADTLDTWYVRDPQGNVMAIYEQALAGNVRETRVSEFALYGAKRLGLCYAGDVVRRQCVSGPCEAVAAELDPASAQRALLVREVMYDSPVAADSLVFGERHDGEFVVVENAVGRTLDLTPVRVVCAGDTLALSGTLGAEETLVIGFAASAARFAEVTQLDTAAVGQRLVLQEALALPDGGGEIELWYAGARIDRVVYGDFHGLVAENDYLSPALLDSLGRRRSLNGLRRIVGGSMGIGSVIGPVASSGTINVEPVVQPWQGRYALFRGQKAYEEANHLGNVLAVVSDLKLGRESGVADSVVDFYVADVRSLHDYWPFGAPLQERQFGGKRYRFGFNGKEDDPRWMGAGVAIDYGFRVQDARVGRFLSVDPLRAQYPMLTTYQYASNTPIWMIDLDGLEGRQAESLSSGQSSQSNRLQNFIMDPVIITDYASKTHDTEWKSFISHVAYNLDAYREDIYQRKLAAYQGGIGIGLYGRNPDGSAAVPLEIRSRLYQEAIVESEDPNILKDAYASAKASGVSWFVRGIARQNIRAALVSSKEEGSKILKGVAFEVGTEWASFFFLGGIQRSPMAGGGGGSGQKMVSIWRAPRRGTVDDVIEKGFQDVGHKSVYFGEKSVASEYARHGAYDPYLIEVKVPKSFAEKFRQIYPDGTSTRFEYRIPSHYFDDLNKFERYKREIQWEW